MKNGMLQNGGGGGGGGCVRKCGGEECQKSLKRCKIIFEQLQTPVGLCAELYSEALKGRAGILCSTTRQFMASADRHRKHCLIAPKI